MIKNELAIFKSVELPNASSTQPLEVILLEKNKKLASELTDAKLESSQWQTELGTMKALLNNSTQAMNQQKNLIAKLEEDLSRLQSSKDQTSPLEKLIGSK